MTDELRLRVTVILRELAQGDRSATDRLMQAVYAPLRALAQEHLAREAGGHSLQATALVHEAYLRMVDQDRVEWNDRDHFFAVAAIMIRRILVDHCRARMAAKRGGGRARVTLDGAQIDSESRVADLLALDDALREMERMDKRRAHIVELKFFGGLSTARIAELTGVSKRTVESDWAFARAWLRKQLATEADS